MTLIVPLGKQCTNIALMIRFLISVCMLTWEVTGYKETIIHTFLEQYGLPIQYLCLCLVKV